jgi:hypothetical protein
MRGRRTEARSKLGLKHEGGCGSMGAVPSSFTLAGTIRSGEHTNSEEVLDGDHCWK